MKKAVILMLWCLLAGNWCNADHITGGEMYYQLTGVSGNSFTYLVSLKLYQRCQSGRNFPNPAITSAFDRLGGGRVQDFSINIRKSETIAISNPDPCISNPPNVCFDVAYYESSITLPGSANGYVLAGMVNFRISNITNLSEMGGRLGALYATEIPGNVTIGTGPNNNSAKFTGSDLVIVCAENPFTYSFAAIDADGDELRYRFCSAFNSTSAAASGGFGSNQVPPSSPPFPEVDYQAGFDGTMPLGNNVQINSTTGLITGVAPAAGIYVVTVCVDETRNGRVIATQRKDVQINVANCGITAALLPPSCMLCDTSFSLSMANLSTSSDIKSYKWLVQNRSRQTLQTYTTPTLTHTFADTGFYFVKLIINEADACTDSAISEVFVYPGFVPRFSFVGLCLSRPTQFTDQSTSRYGLVNKWKWEFGESMSSNDTSSASNPTYLYPSAGPKLVQLIAGNNLGCLDTVFLSLPISNKPPLLLSVKDTLICKGDTLLLSAAGSGNIVWSPAGSLTNINGGSTRAFPAATTRYYASLNDNGCQNSDSLLVRVVSTVTLATMPDTTICSGDAITLRIQSDGLLYSWTPIEQLSNAQAKSPLASTTTNTQYRVSATIGGCIARDSILVNTVPYPNANAGPDTVICFNGAAILQGTGSGMQARWLPAAGLGNTSLFTTAARPAATTSYILQVFDNKGCPKPGTDTVLITVLPPIKAFAGNDTSILVGQVLQLHGSGGSRVQWSPSNLLAGSDTYTPVAQFGQASEGIRFQMVAFNEAGCSDSAWLTIKVFAKGNSIYMPTGFTPNGDGKNDVLRPTLPGIKRIEDFSVYNRYGQLLFRTTTPGKGWDGKFGGIAQPAGTYVWMIRVIAFDETPASAKGTAVLVR